MATTNSFEQFRSLMAPANQFQSFRQATTGPPALTVDEITFYAPSESDASVGPASSESNHSHSVEKVQIKVPCSPPTIDEMAFDEVPLSYPSQQRAERRPAKRNRPGKRDRRLLAATAASAQLPAQQHQSALPMQEHIVMIQLPDRQVQVTVQGVAPLTPEQLVQLVHQVQSTVYVPPPTVVYQVRHF
jgi:hypothetical protein